LSNRSFYSAAFAGGHNGLKSIDERLGNSNTGYHRIRIGIGKPSKLDAKGKTIDHVLSPYTDEEKRPPEMQELQEELHRDPPYHSGEVTGPGTLYCGACNEALHFHHTARVPACPHCDNDTFRRWPLQKD